MAMGVISRKITWKSLLNAGYHTCLCWFQHSKRVWWLTRRCWHRPTCTTNRSNPPTRTANEPSSQDRTQRRQRGPHQKRGNGMQGNLKRPYIADISCRRPQCTARFERFPYHLKEQVFDFSNYRRKGKHGTNNFCQSSPQWRLFKSE